MKKMQVLPNFTLVSCSLRQLSIGNVQLSIRENSVICRKKFGLELSIDN